MRMNTVLRYLSLFLLIVTAGHGALSWDSKTIELKAELDAKNSVAVFEFENVGDSEITITELKTSCGCTATHLDKKTYAPGESGFIEAVLNIGSRNGVQRKTVRVYTSDSEQPEVLTMVTHIPVLLEISPRFLFWKEGEAFEPKFIDLNIGIDEAVDIVSVESNSEQFETELVAVEQGKSYRLKVAPSVGGKARAVIKVKTNYPAKDPKEFSVHALVR